jgi:hypothetical protein
MKKVRWYVGGSSHHPLLRNRTSPLNRVPSHTCTCHIGGATAGNLRRHPGARTVHVRLLDSEYRAQARGAAEPRCLRGLVDDRVIGDEAS